jgi:hypothetical protein
MMELKLMLPDRTPEKLLISIQVEILINQMLMEVELISQDLMQAKLISSIQTEISIASQLIIKEFMLQVKILETQFM